mgnify:CR=1 FL=1
MTTDEQTLVKLGPFSLDLSTSPPNPLHLPPPAMSDSESDLPEWLKAAGDSDGSSAPDEEELAPRPNEWLILASFLDRGLFLSIDPFLHNEGQSCLASQLSINRK